MRVGVVGAGIAGVMAGRTLAEAGHEVVLFDKGRSPGGRLATRRIGAARLDHGAQFVTVRDEEMAALVDGWVTDGVVVEWCRGFGVPDGHPRYAVRGGMSSLAKHVAAGLDVRCGSLVFRIEQTASGWEIGLDDASTTAVDAVVVTCPLPQTASLLFGTGVRLPDVLARGEYERTLALLAVLDGASAVPEPGGVQGAAIGDPAVSFVADNQRKGVSEVPAVTLHANAAWSAAHWDDEPDAVSAALVELARPWLGSARIVERQVKRWRFATPLAIWPDRCWQPDDAARTRRRRRRVRWPAGRRCRAERNGSRQGSDGVIGGSGCQHVPVPPLAFDDDLRTRCPSASTGTSCARRRSTGASTRRSRSWWWTRRRSSTPRTRTRSARTSWPPFRATRRGSTAGWSTSPAVRRSCCAGEHRG